MGPVATTDDTARATPIARIAVRVCAVSAIIGAGVIPRELPFQHIPAHIRGVVSGKPGLPGALHPLIVRPHIRGRNSIHIATDVTTAVSGGHAVSPGEIPSAHIGRLILKLLLGRQTKTRPLAQCPLFRRRIDHQYRGPGWNALATPGYLPPTLGAEVDRPVQPGSRSEAPGY